MVISPYLENHKSKLTDELRIFMQQILPEEVRCVEVMVFRESLPHIPFRVFFLDRFQGPAKTIDGFEPLEGLDILIDSPEYITREDAQFNPINLKTGLHIKHMQEYSQVFDG